MELKGVYYNQVIKQQLGITTKKTLQRVVEEEEVGHLTENIHADVVQTEENSEKDGKKGKKNKKDKKDKKDKKKKEKKPDMKRVFMMNSPEWFYIVGGCIASILSGAVQPAFSIILSKAVGVRLLGLNQNNQSRDLISTRYSLSVATTSERARLNFIVSCLL